MSVFSGRQGKGAMRVHRAAKRAQAAARQALADELQAAWDAARAAEAGPRCRKVRYPTEQEALEALTNAKIGRTFHHKQRRREMRHYACSNCRGWHLSSRPFNKIKPQGEAA